MLLRVLLVGVSLLFIPLLSPAPAPAGENPHDFRNRCRSCHLTEPREGEEQIFTQKIDALCLSCHQMNVANSHPTRIIPETEVPSFMPLDKDGEITCATCHDPHGKKTGHLPFLLRVDARGAFTCESCHSDGDQSNGLCMVTAGIAHVKTRTRPDSTHFSQRLDRISLNCLACHGSAASEATPMHRAMPEKTSIMGAGFAHPIGANYDDVANWDQGYRDPGQLSPMVALYEGKVGCFSCHNPFGNEKSRLVMQGRASLCLECHLK